MKQILLAVVVYALAHSAAFAREYSTEENLDASGVSQVEGVSFDFDAKVEFQVLFGEPVINAHIKWTIDPTLSIVEIPSWGPGDDPFETVPLYDLGSAAYDKVRLFNVKLQFQFVAPSGETVNLLQDVGDPEIGNGEKWSFNVSGSPNWTEVFYRSSIGSIDDARSFYSEKEAQSFFLGALELVDVTIIEAEVSFHDLHDWYAENTPEPRVIALKEAYVTIAEGLKESFGLELNVEKDFDHQPVYLDPLASGNRLREFQVLADHLEKQIEKFSELPEAFKTRGDPAAYYEALAQATDIVQRQVTFRFDSPDLDPLDFNKGKGDRLPNGAIEGPFIVEVPKIKGKIDESFRGTLEVKFRDGEVLARIPMAKANENFLANWSSNIDCYYCADTLPPVFNKDFIRFGTTVFNQAGDWVSSAKMGLGTDKYILTATNSGVLSMYDDQLELVWEKTYEGVEFGRIGGFFNGWAWATIAVPSYSSEYVEGHVLLSEDGTMISAKQLGFEYMSFESDFSYGKFLIWGRRNGKSSSMFVNPDLSLEPAPANIVDVLHGGLAVVCTGPKDSVGRCYHPKRVETIDTGEVIIPALSRDHQFRAAYLRDRFIISVEEFVADPKRTFGGDSRYSYYELNGDRIENLNGRLLTEVGPGRTWH